MCDDKLIVAIVDDHPVVIEGLKVLLSNVDIIKEAISFTKGNEFVQYLKSNVVDIVLLDISLTDANGIDVCREIKKISPDVTVLALSNQAERSIILQMLQSGANGYLLKNASADELIKCISEAREGSVTFSKEVKEIMAKPSQYDLQSIPSLTKREKQIVQMIADGKTSQQIAETLFISPFTVETHRRNLLQKMQVKNVAELIKVANEFRLL